MVGTIVVCIMKNVIMDYGKFYVSGLYLAKHGSHSCINCFMNYFLIFVYFVILEQKCICPGFIQRKRKRNHSTASMSGGSDVMAVVVIVVLVWGFFIWRGNFRCCQKWWYYVCHLFYTILGNITYGKFANLE